MESPTSKFSEFSSNECSAIILAMTRENDLFSRVIFPQWLRNFLILTKNRTPCNPGMPAYRLGASYTNIMNHKLPLPSPNRHCSPCRTAVCRALLVLSATFMLITYQAKAAATIYDFATDFSTTSGNPNGAWSYGYKPLIDNKPTGAFVALSVNDSIPNAGRAWGYYEPGGGGLVWMNEMSYDQYNIAPGHLSLEGDPGNTTTARWTAPTSDYIDLAVAFGGSGAARYIMLNDTLLAEGDYQNSNLYVNTGDTIDVTAYGASAYGNTQTDITISVIPEATTLTLLGAGTLGLVFRRKSKA